MENEELMLDEKFNLNQLSSEELLELYNEIDNHLKYLNNNILTQEEEE